MKVTQDWHQSTAAALVLAREAGERDGAQFSFDLDAEGWKCLSAGAFVDELMQEAISAAADLDLDPDAEATDAYLGGFVDAAEKTWEAMQ